MGYQDRNRLWFGTAQGQMRWFPTPLQGADMSPAGWAEGGTMLNGGGYQQTSYGSHKTYNFEWPETSAPAVAALMKAYSDGTYGRGLIYFVDPLIYQRNTAPARLADPSMALDHEGVSMVSGITPTASGTPNFRTHKLPVRSATYDLTGITPGFRGAEEAVFLPIPEGYFLLLGAVYTATSGTAGVFASWQDSEGVIQPPQRLTPLGTEAPLLLQDAALQGEGVWVWLGKTGGQPASVTFSAFMSRLVPVSILEGAGRYGDGFYGEITPYGGSATLPYQQGPWMGGLGHSGCRFIGKPTYIANTGVNGGQVSFAASFREVGSWAY